MLLLSGGVSAGKLDLVPGVLREAGVAAHFHKVEMKPGKPVFFGTAQRLGGGEPTLVFGLPGNPVSVLVCFELFVRPALRRLRGHADPGPHVRLRRAQRGFHLSHGSTDVSPGSSGAGCDGLGRAAGAVDRLGGFAGLDAGQCPDPVAARRASPSGGTGRSTC